MKRAFLVNRATGEVSDILIADDDGVRRYFDRSDDVYGKVLEKVDNGSVVRVWRTRDKARDIEVYTAHDRRTLETVDLEGLPAEARVGLEVQVTI